MVITIQVIEEIPSGPITMVEGITVELLKADMITLVDILHDRFCQVRISRDVHADGTKGIIISLAKKGDLTKCKKTRGGSP